MFLKIYWFYTTHLVYTYKYYGSNPTSKTLPWLAENQNKAIQRELPKSISYENSLSSRTKGKKIPWRKQAIHIVNIYNKLNIFWRGNIFWWGVEDSTPNQHDGVLNILRWRNLRNSRYRRDSDLSILPWSRSQIEKNSTSTNFSK